MSQKKLSMILPCYNPDSNWAVNILIRYREICNLLPDYLIDLVLVNDGSLRDLENETRLLQEQVPRLKVLAYPVNKGKGYAIRKGVEQAEGEYIVYTDIDFPYTNDSMIRIVKGLEEHDITIGTRGDSYYDNIPRHRAWISKLLRFLIRSSLRIPTNDTQGGLKGMRGPVKAYFLQTVINRYLFDLEFVCIAASNGLSIGLIPVTLNENTVVRKMNLKVVSREIFNFAKLYSRMLFRK